MLRRCLAECGNRSGVSHKADNSRGERCTRATTSGHVLGATTSTFRLTVLLTTRACGVSKTTRGAGASSGASAGRSSGRRPTRDAHCAWMSEASRAPVQPRERPAGGRRSVHRATAWGWLAWCGCQQRRRRRREVWARTTTASAGPRHWEVARLAFGQARRWLSAARRLLAWLGSAVCEAITLLRRRARRRLRHSRWRCRPIEAH